MDINNIILGSGTVYVAEYNDATGIPTDSVLETDTNTMGRIKGGATLTYKPTTYEVVDDSHYVVKRFITSEEVSFKSGVLTWNLNNLNRLCGSGEIATVSGKTTLKIGGRAKNGLKAYVVRFVHEDDEKIVRVSLVGTSTDGFSLAFTADKETVVDAVWKALSHDDEGTQVIIEETKKA